MKEEIFSLGKDSIIYGIGSVITRFIGIITLPLFTAYLRPEEYGVLAMLSLLTMVAHPVFSLGLSAAMGPSYFEGNSLENKHKAVWTVLSINAVSAVLLMLIAWTFPVYLGQLVRLPAEYALLVQLSLSGCALTILVTSFTQRVQFEKQAKLYVTITLATAITAIIVSIITVVILGWGVKGMVVGQLTGNFITFISFLVVGLKATRPAVSSAMAKELLRLGLPLVPSFAFLFLLMHGNKYILEWKSGLDAVGIYSIGFNLGTAISIVTGGIATAWYPFFMSYIERLDEARVIFGRILTYYVFGVGFICICFFLAAKPVVLILTKEAFHSADVVVGFVALAYFAQTFFNFFLPALYYTKEVKYVSIVQGLSVVISLPLYYFLIIKFDVFGAALGLALGNIMMAILLYGWFYINRNRYINIKYEWGRIFSFAITALLLIFLYYQMPDAVIWGEIITSIIFGLLTFCCIFFLLNKNEKSILIKKVIKNEF